MKSKPSKKSSRNAPEEIEFNADDLIASLREHRESLQGGRKLTLHVTTLKLAPPAPSLSPQDIAAIRAGLNVSQPIFAAALNVPLNTLRSWEKGRRAPTGAALRLLDIARRQPDALMQTAA